MLADKVEIVSFWHVKNIFLEFYNIFIAKSACFKFL